MGVITVFRRQHPILMAGGPQLPASSLSPVSGPVISTSDERAVSRQQKATQELELGNQVDNTKPFQLVMLEKKRGGRECRAALCEQSYAPVTLASP